MRTFACALSLHLFVGHFSSGTLPRQSYSPFPLVCSIALCALLPSFSLISSRSTGRRRTFGSFNLATLYRNLFSLFSRSPTAQIGKCSPLRIHGATLELLPASRLYAIRVTYIRSIPLSVLIYISVLVGRPIRLSPPRPFDILTYSYTAPVLSQY